ncbi:aspartyl-tRNA synthetase [Histoplasma mississippiense (nom. inval.)]|uniref:aspartyl-tRNA synthetase n=1 Tax=Ajellomyces capsulatus (strain NAm1 / WU24) TaxID=2059318 RepID=UPI000157C6A8|nr:aspartyl-tRNA synthetase [Histoplasma mississippiense (nom. inval.)]EDN08829.1 aspartyl-tRNA synthetase [Histoplasma mississippiense (nom. inval.)]
MYSDYYGQFASQLPRQIDAEDPSKSLNIDAILVFNDPRDWALDIQIIIDILLSSQGIIGTYSSKNNNPDLPNRGYQQDGQPPLYFSNPDLLWAAQYHQPRLGQGAFKASLEVYMIGDNPESDIQGANSYKSPVGTKWSSILLKSGVYSGGTPTWPPKVIVEGVKQAVEWSLAQSRWPLCKTPFKVNFVITKQNFRSLTPANSYAPCSFKRRRVTCRRNPLVLSPPLETPPPPSKSALKKAAKEREKAEKAAKRAAQEQAAAQASQAADFSKHLYGPIPDSADKVQVLNLLDLSEELCEKDVTVVARVDNARVQSAKLAFLMLRQQGKKMQAVVSASDEISRPMVKWIGGINVNSIVKVTAVVKKAEIPVTSATVKHLELHIRKVYLVAQASHMLPMQVKDAERPPPESVTEEVESEAPYVTLKTRLDNRVLDLQTEASQAITWISSGVAQLFMEYMLKSGSRWISTPKLTANASEGGAGVFEVTYFKRKAYLAQSPQLYKQMCIAGDMESVFEIGPVFRAEESNTHRHLTEFVGLDFEKTFQSHYHEVLEFAEDLLVFVLSELKIRFKKEIEVIQRSYPKAGDFRLPKDGKALRLKYMEGVALLKEAGVDVTEQERFENDLSTAMEKQLGRIIREKYDTDFYVLDKFPMAVRPFYTKPCPDDPTFSNSYDFFMRGEEIMSGAQRINEAKELEAAMSAKGLDPNAEGFEDYIGAFRQGCPPHAGGGLGLNRIVMFFLGLPNIRLATLFPRDPQRLRP